jgi:hypothetical protein
MIRPDELIVFLIGVVVLFFFLVNRSRLMSEPYTDVLLAAFSFLLGGWCLVIVEGFFRKDILNLLEHLCYSLSSLMLAYWCFKVFGPGEKRS